jgi:hypothetical protein
MDPVRQFVIRATVSFVALPSPCDDRRPVQAQVVASITCNLQTLYTLLRDWWDCVSAAGAGANAGPIRYRYRRGAKGRIVPQNCQQQTSQSDVGTCDYGTAAAAAMVATTNSGREALPATMTIFGGAGDPTKRLLDPRSTTLCGPASFLMGSQSSASMLPTKRPRVCATA